MSKSLSSNEKTLLRNANVRLCRLCLWPNFQGLGFDLVKSSQPPHHIGLVRSNSPAAAGGLKIRDVVLAVNQQNVSNADYDQVTDIIQTARDSNSYVELLVVEQHFYQELRKNKIAIDQSLARIIDTPPTMPFDYLNFPKHQPRTCDIRLNKSDTEFGFETVNGKNADKEDDNVSTDEIENEYYDQVRKFY
jgi:hypothetical protein